MRFAETGGDVAENGELSDVIRVAADTFDFH